MATQAASLSPCGRNRTPGHNKATDDSHPPVSFKKTMEVSEAVSQCDAEPVGSAYASIRPKPIAFANVSRFSNRTVISPKRRLKG